MILSQKIRVDRDPSYLDCFSDEKMKVQYYFTNCSKSQR